ncbi:MULTISPECIES: PepSY-associated TM helix domain-containing protein [Luteimonas]|uniref:PepSY-associated TM helix domain-containing protein n=1 Tax=Luteimonas TaxID=83614 RepID=UPI000C7D8908|nr:MULTISPECIES: PepSY-associated TM helix domain-containing protein [Luteimonas]
MKFRSATLRRFTALHTWVGLAAGFALFVAFYAGAITVFHHDLMLWQAPHAADAPVHTLDDAQRLLDETLARHADARTHVGMLFPGPESPHAISYWQDAHGTWQYATLDAPDGTSTLPHAALSELVNALHYALGLPGIGTWFMGAVSLLYGVALISGVVIHLPKLAKDLFALRPGRNRKQFWQDAHNVVGVLSLPVHVMFAVTGALLCLMMVALLALDPLVHRGQAMAALPAAFDTAPVVAPAASPAGPLPLSDLTRRARQAALAQGLDAFEPAYLKLANAGDANAVIEITGAAPRTLGPLGAVALDAASGAVLATELPGRRDANHATLQIAYALHFAEFGNAWIRVLYFVLGLGGAFLFYSGNLLWIESRRRRRQVTQTRTSMATARATIGLCLGVCVAISVAFVATQLLEWQAPAWADRGIPLACFLTWAGCLVWAALRPPIRAARELLLAAAWASAAIPVAHGVASGWWLWRSAGAGHWALFAIDAGALALAVGFATLARATARRARDSDPCSVWADPALTRAA